MQLFNDYIMVRAIKEEEKETKSGLIILDNIDDDQTSQGIVLESSSSDFNKDDKVLFHRVIPIEGRLDNDQVWFLKTKDIIAKL